MLSYVNLLIWRVCDLAALGGLGFLGSLPSFVMNWKRTFSLGELQMDKLFSAKSVINKEAHNQTEWHWVVSIPPGLRPWTSPILPHYLPSKKQSQSDHVRNLLRTGGNCSYFTCWYCNSMFFVLKKSPILFTKKVYKNQLQVDLTATCSTKIQVQLGTGVRHGLFPRHLHGRHPQHHPLRPLLREAQAFGGAIFLERQVLSKKVFKTSKIFWSICLLLWWLNYELAINRNVVVVWYFFWKLHRTTFGLWESFVNLEKSRSGPKECRTKRDLSRDPVWCDARHDSNCGCCQPIH